MRAGSAPCLRSCLVRGLFLALLGTALFHLNVSRLAAQAEATTGVIRGTVRDPAGDPLPAAVVAAQHRETDLLTRVETDMGRCPT